MKTYKQSYGLKQKHSQSQVSAFIDDLNVRELNLSTECDKSFAVSSKTSMYCVAAIPTDVSMLTS